MKKILFISVHPDDETLGCGGSILKHKKIGDNISWMIITAPTLNHPYNFTNEFIKEREVLVNNVAQKYEFDNIYNLNFPTQLLDEINFRDLIISIDQVINELKPNVVYFVNRSDIHSDHRVAFSAIFSCTKNFRKPFIEKILVYETLSETEFAPAFVENVFIPNLFIDISEFMDKKIEIMSMFESEVMPDNLPRSINAIKSLAGYRGSRIGVQYAEAFMLLFEKL